METLFKYTSINYIRSCIENGIYASKLDNINDPYEGKGIRYKDNYRVVCLTNSPLRMLMWSYYGNHRGCCVEFDVSRIDGIQFVNYTTEFKAHEDMSTEEVIRSLYCKGNEWKHENEYRIVYHSGIADNTIWRKVDDAVFLVAPVKSIVFGLTADMDDKYIDSLEYLKKYNEVHDRKIRISKCRLMSSKYQLKHDKQFDLDSEIKTVTATLSKQKGKEHSVHSVRVEGETIIIE